MVEFTLSGPSWFDDISDPVIWGLDHKVAYMNPTAASLIGEQGRALTLNGPVPDLMDALLPRSETALTWLGHHWIVRCRAVSGGKIYRLVHTAPPGIPLERLSQISSRLRVPLSNLFASIQEMELGTQSKEKIAQRKAIESRSCHRLMRILDALECLTDMAEEESLTCAVILDFGGLCHEIVETATPLAALAHRSVSLEQQPGNLLVYGNERMLGQTLYHLITNALQAAGDGGSVFLRLEHRGQMLRLSVSDTGPGFAPIALSSAFDPAQDDGAPSHGLGLGIAICRSVVLRHGGRIALVDGEGGRVIVELPMCPVPQSGGPDPDRTSNYNIAGDALTQLSDVLPWQAYLGEWSDAV